MDPAQAAALDAAIGAIQRDQGQEAEALLLGLLAADLSPALRARVYALLAQSLLAQGRASEAAPQARLALAAARALGDVYGVEQVRELYGRIYARMSEDAQQAQRREEEARAAARPLEALLLEANSPAERVLAMVRKVNALAEQGSPDAALGQQAVDEAMALPEAPREKVLALLALARCLPGRRDLYERALAVADAADETALVGAIARAARAEDIAFEPKIFGS